jgi:hypothetical protein
MQRRRREFELELLEREIAVAEPALAEPAAVAGEPVETRETLARSAQQRAGNRSVAGVLARDPNPSLVKEPTKRPAKLPLKTGREVDAIFDSSPYLKDLVGSKLRKVSLEKQMVLDEDDAFEAAWLEYAQRSYNPVTNAHYTEEEARTYLKTKGVRAFQDEDRRSVHILKSRSDLGTQLHEGLHLHSDDGWKKHTDYHVNEGVTEYFTRQIGPEVGVERDINSFLREFTSAEHLVKAVGKEAVAAAYFEGDLAALEQKVDSLKPDGKGTWRKWRAHVEAEEYKLANALIDAQAAR